MPMSEQACHQVVRELYAKYGRAMPLDGSRKEVNLGAAWKPEIQDLTPPQIEHGMQLAMDKSKQPPNAAEFAKYCKQRRSGSTGGTCGNHGCPVPVGAGTDWCEYHQHSPHWQHSEISERLQQPEVLRQVKFVMLLRRMSAVERVTGDQEVAGGAYVWPWADAVRAYWMAHPPEEWAMDDDTAPGDGITIDARNGFATTDVVAIRENPEVYLARMANAARLAVGAMPPAPVHTTQKAQSQYRTTKGPQEAFV